MFWSLQFPSMGHVFALLQLQFSSFTGGFRFVVVGYCGFDVTHAAITQCKCIHVENFVKWV